jgi:hypothetical protein
VRRALRLSLGLGLGLAVLLIQNSVYPHVAAAQQACPDPVSLRPVVVSGPLWERHRQHLVVEKPVAWSGSYNILDATTGESYPWVMWADGVTVGVPTRWAYTHPDWTLHSYRLVPGCQSSLRESDANGR